MPFWGIKPEEEKPERRKAIAPYQPTPPPGKSERRFYLLARDAEITTPAGCVEAQAGDVLEARENGLWVLAAEVLQAAGVEVKEKQAGAAGL